MEIQIIVHALLETEIRYHNLKSITKLSIYEAQMIINNSTKLHINTKYAQEMPLKNMIFYYKMFTF